MRLSPWIASGLLPASALSLGLLLLCGARASAQDLEDGDLAPAAETDGDSIQDEEDIPDEEDRAAETRVEEELAREPSPSTTTQPSEVGFIVTGIGLGLLAVAVPLASTAAYAVFELEDGCTDGVCPAALESSRDTAAATALATDIFLGVGGATTLAGLVLLFVLTEEVDRQEQSDLSANASCGPTGCQLSLGGRF